MVHLQIFCRALVNDPRRLAFVHIILRRNLAGKRNASAVTRPQQRNFRLHRSILRQIPEARAPLSSTIAWRRIGRLLPTNIDWAMPLALGDCGSFS
jgi:hypothetical protein